MEYFLIEYCGKGKDEWNVVSGGTYMLVGSIYK